MYSYQQNSSYGSYYYSDYVPSYETYNPQTAKNCRTGLSNIGNTCYMNTAIQCLSHLPRLAQFLITDEYKQYLNVENKSGTGGKVINVFADVLKSLWLGSSSAITPRRFKEVVETFATQFQGYSQHDSQEFIIMLLDLIHEDINKVSIKPYIELPTYDHFDPQQSAEMWGYHLCRQQSQIIDWFYGQNITFIKCCKCGEQRVKYEPFSLLTLPLPPERVTVRVNVLKSFFSENDPLEMYPEMVTVHGTVKDTVESVISSVAQQLDIPATRLVLATVSRNNVSEVNSLSSINILIGPTVVVYVLSRERQPTDKIIFIYPSAIQLKTMCRSVVSRNYYYGSAEKYKSNDESYEFFPLIEVPVLFLYQENDSLMDMTKRICERLVDPFVSDRESAQNALIQWEEKCHKMAADMEKEQQKEWERYEEERLCRERENQLRNEAWFQRNNDFPATSPFTHVNISKPADRDTHYSFFDQSHGHSLKKCEVEDTNEKEDNLTPSESQDLIISCSDTDSMKVVFSESDSSRSDKISSIDGDLTENHIGGLTGGLPGGSNEYMFSTSLHSHQSDIDSSLSMNEGVSDVHHNDSDQLKDYSWHCQAPFFPLIYPTHGDWHDGLILCDNSSISFASAVGHASSLHLILIPIITSMFERPILFSEYHDFSSFSLNSPDFKSNPIVESLVNTSATTLHSSVLSRWNNEDDETGVELSECLQLYTQHGNLDENNKWFCPHCQDHMCAESVTRVDKLPEILILQLERFEYSQSGLAYGYGGGRRKISTLVHFPIHDLNMQPWLYDSTSIPAEDAIYDLTAICNHSGSSSGGHYYCYARDENDGVTRWFEYNDSGVYEKGEEGLIRDTAYVLFYQRRNGRISSKDVCERVQSLHDEYVASHPREMPSTNDMVLSAGNESSVLKNGPMETKWWCEDHEMNEMSVENDRRNELSTENNRTNDMSMENDRTNTWNIETYRMNGKESDENSVSSLDRSPDPLWLQKRQKPIEVAIPQETIIQAETDQTPIEVVIDDEVKPDPVLKQGMDVLLPQHISTHAEPALSDSDDLYILNVCEQTNNISNTSI